MLPPERNTWEATIDYARAAMYKKIVNEPARRPGSAPASKNWHTPLYRRPGDSKIQHEFTTVEAALRAQAAERLTMAFYNDEIEFEKMINAAAERSFDETRYGKNHVLGRRLPVPGDKTGKGSKVGKAGKVNKAGWRSKLKSKMQKQDEDNGEDDGESLSDSDLAEDFAEGDDNYEDYDDEGSGEMAKPEKKDRHPAKDNWRLRPTIRPKPDGRALHWRGGNMGNTETNSL